MTQHPMPLVGPAWEVSRTRTSYSVSRYSGLTTM